ncbi:HlyD family efflux transporter periplasmic adaptor subunit [Demequina sp.]|uniref:HlyD family efflux transporter periplasmic adaptor subunit n=1 Tax=Demequina sp. TaxID=2050685 RepID=UPI0025EEAC17|nr:HlyD family secretion protein [Demequina sp.]
MTWTNRFKMFFGIIAVLLIVAAATLVFNQRQTHVLSSSAQIAAERYDVGTDYGGLVLERYVDEGDTVTAGQRLYDIESLTLSRDLEQGLVTDDSSTIAGDGTLVVRASVDGTVTDLTVDAGGYASSGGVVATIDREGTLFAEAEFILSPRDFGRITDDAAVELRLPDGRQLAGVVSEISVETVDGDAHVTARIDSEQLVQGDANGLIAPGTPLEATLLLRDDGPLAGVTDALGDLARKVGL